MNIATILPLADTWGMHGNDVGVGWMMIPMVLFWGAVILGIVWLARGAFDGSRRGRRETPLDPLDVLERRFAEGAISVEDYHQRRDVLTTGTRRDQGAGADSPEAARTSERDES